MVKHRDIFAQGAAKQGINREKADEIFDYMEKFAGYGFNKSHAAAYAYVSFQTAWLKAHYPAEFMAATMSSELDNTDQLKIFYDDARSKLNGITFLPPDVNESYYRFIPNNQKQIRYALGAIKGTGEAAVNAIVAARESGGKFKNLFDFCERVGKQHINRRTVEALIRGGAFDGLETNRALLLANVELALQNADQKANNANQGGLFDMLDDAIEELEMLPEKAWSESQKLAEEKQAIGFYLSGHPFEPHRAEVRQFSKTPLAQLRPTQHMQLIAGFATQIRTIMGKNGKFIAITLEDNTASQEVIVRGEALDNLSKDALKTDQILIADCRISEDTYSGELGALRISANAVYTQNEARVAYARGLSLNVNPSCDVAKLMQILQQNQQKNNEHRISLKLNYENEQAKGILLPSAKWRMGLSTDFLLQLEALLGEENVIVN